MTKFGLLDAGGGMRGVYTAGIYDYLIDRGIKPEYCLGISAGSANMITYIAGQRDRDRRFYTDYILRPEYMSVRNFFKTGEYLSLDYIYSVLSNSDGEDPLDFDAFMASDCVFIVPATDAETGEQVFFTNDDFEKDNLQVLKASSALPIACKPVKVKNRLYFDGGLAEPIPYRRVFEDGCDKAVIIITRTADEIRGPQKNMWIFKMWLRKYPAIVKALAERHIKYNRAIAEIKELEKEGKVLLIAPDDICGMGSLTKDMDTINAIYKKGYEDAKKIEDFMNR